MPEIDYYADRQCSHEMQLEGNTLLWYRGAQLIEAEETAPFAEPGFAADDVFTLREFNPSGEKTFEADVALAPFLAGISYTEDSSKGEIEVGYNALTQRDLNWPAHEDVYRTTPVTSVISQGVCVFCPHPEGQLVAVSVADGSKGIERWRKDVRNSRYNAVVTAWQILGVDHEGMIVAAFRERRYKNEEARSIKWNPEWGVDDDYIVTDVRSPDNSGEYGAYPAGIAWIHPVTGIEQARWYGEARSLDGPTIPRGYIYESHGWSPGEDVPRAEVRRPYGSEIVSFAPDGSGYTYEWSNNGHEKWGFGSVRFAGAEGTVECAGITANSDFINPYYWVNFVGSQFEWKTISGSGSYYYAYPSQTVTWRYIGELDEPAQSDLRGSDPPHSLTSCCLTRDGLVVFGPRYHGNYGYATGDEVEVYDPHRFVFRAVRRAGASSTIVWETSLGRTPDTPEVDTLRNRQSTTPICVGDKILSVIQDNLITGSETVHGLARFVGLSAETGEVLWDNELDPALWGSAPGQQVYIYPEAQMRFGKFVARVNGHEIAI